LRHTVKKQSIGTRKVHAVPVRAEVGIADVTVGYSDGSAAGFEGKYGGRAGDGRRDIGGASFYINVRQRIAGYGRRAAGSDGNVIQGNRAAARPAKRNLIGCRGYLNAIWHSIPYSGDKNTAPKAIAAIQAQVSVCLTAPLAWNKTNRNRAGGIALIR
jgi:hypothetical protein